MNDAKAMLAAIEADENAHDARLAYADMVADSGDETLACVIRAQVTHNLPFATVAVKEVTIENIQDDYDWGEVLGEQTSGNCTNETDACPPGAEVDLTPPKRADIAEVIAAVNGENGGPDWVGVFRMKDGRFIVANGGCDYTGWD